MSIEDEKFESDVPETVTKTSPRAETFLPDALRWEPKSSLAEPKLDASHWGSEIPLYVPSPAPTIVGAPKTVPLDLVDFPAELVQRTVPLKPEDLPLEAQRPQMGAEVVHAQPKAVPQSTRSLSPEERERVMRLRSHDEKADRLVDDFVAHHRDTVQDRRFFIRSALFVAIGIAGYLYYKDQNAVALYPVQGESAAQIPSSLPSTRPSVSASVAASSSASVSVKPVVKPVVPQVPVVPVNPDKDLDDLGRDALCQEYKTLGQRIQDDRNRHDRSLPPGCGRKQNCKDLEEWYKKDAEMDANEKRHDRLWYYIKRHNITC